MAKYKCFHLSLSFTSCDLHHTPSAASPPPGQALVTRSAGVHGLYPRGSLLRDGAELCC